MSNFLKALEPAFNIFLQGDCQALLAVSLVGKMSSATYCWNNTNPKEFVT